MVQDKKKGMADSSDKKGRLEREEDEKASAQKSTGKTPVAPSKNSSSSSRKSR